MKTTNLYWLAGLLEGEGSFHNHYEAGTPYIQLSMSDEDSVERAAFMLGSAAHKYKPNGIGKKPVFHVALGGRRAMGWMLTLYPLMGSRRQDAIRRVLSTYYKAPSYRRGENHPMRRLTLEKVREIRSAEGLHREIAQKYEVSRSTVSLIRSGKIWKE